MKQAHSGRRVVIVALLVNLLIAAAKFAAAVVSQSAAMLAEAVHSLADTLNQVFLLVGMRRSSRSPDALHPFGYGTETYLWAFIVAGCIFFVGGAVSLTEAVEKLWRLYRGQPSPHGDLRFALATLGISIVLELVSLRAALSGIRQTQAGKSLRQMLRDARDPTVLTVLFEDLAALAGLVFALAGVVATYLTGNPLWDALASLLVGLTLGCVGAMLGKNAMGLLVGEAVPEEEHGQILQVIGASPGVLRVVHARTMHLGPLDVLLAVKVEFERGLTVEALEERINDIERALRASMPHLRRIYVEPGFDEARLREHQRQARMDELLSDISDLSGRVVR